MRDSGTVSNLKSYILTWILSVTATCVIGAAWIYTHPAQKFVTVDIASLFSESAQTLAKNKDLNMAQAQAQKIDFMLQQLADACDCLVMNSAAIAKRPGKETTSTIDMTEWVKERIKAE